MRAEPARAEGLPLTPLTSGTDPLPQEPPVTAVRSALGEARAWIVGGTVRDAVLGRPVRDVDVAVAGSAGDAARAVGRALGGPVFKLSEAFGAWRAIDRRTGFACDVTPLQGEAIEDDLAQRDFTVNAMGVPVAGAELLDPHGGRADAEAGVLRVLGASAYQADPLRPLRLARLSTELELAPDRETERLTHEWAVRVTEASPERVFEELKRLVVADRALDGLALCEQLGLTAAVLPELEALHAVEQSHFHHLDVYEHTLDVLRHWIEVEREPERFFGELGAPLRGVLDEPLSEGLTRGQAMRFAALLHDVGKPGTRGARPDGRVTFIGHDALGAELVRAICRRLRASERLASFLAQVTRHHLILGFMVHDRPLSRRAVYRYLAACDPVAVEVTAFSCADRMATRGRRAEEAIAAHLELARALLPEALAWRSGDVPRPPIRGDDLARELGIAPGPEIGRLLREIEEAAFAGDVVDRAGAVEHARTRLSAGGG